MKVRKDVPFDGDFAEPAVEHGTHNVEGLGAKCRFVEARDGLLIMSSSEPWGITLNLDLASMQEGENGKIFDGWFDADYAAEFLAVLDDG